MEDAGQQKVAAAGHENAEHTKHAAQLRPVLESWSHARFPASRANNGGKLCHFVRHGQGTHNKLAEEIGHSAYQSPQVADIYISLHDIGALTDVTIFSVCVVEKSDIGIIRWQDITRRSHSLTCTSRKPWILKQSNIRMSFKWYN